MTYLIDSDWIIDFLSRRRAALDLFERLRQEPLGISVITYVEVLEGVYYGRDIMQNRRRFEVLVQDNALIALNRPILQRAARIRGHLRKTGRRIGDMDTLIAATAVYHRLTLVTRNTRGFQRVPGPHPHGYVADG